MNKITKPTIKKSKGKATNWALEGFIILMRIKLIVIANIKTMQFAALLMKAPLSPFFLVKKVT